MDEQTLINILFIDDDSNAGLMAKLYLERYNFKVYVAKNTQKARNLLEKYIFKLIISDIGMPGENGIEFCKWLKKEEIYKNIPVFLISAHASNLADLDPNSDVEFFEKPLFFPKLIDKINKVIG
ncbi:MAG: response regulator [Calditrichaceae bacterium]|jgi:DNA-binding response OmpR family regulator